MPQREHLERLLPIANFLRTIRFKFIARTIGATTTNLSSLCCQVLKERFGKRACSRRTRRHPFASYRPSDVGRLRYRDCPPNAQPIVTAHRKGDWEIYATGGIIDASWFSSDSLRGFYRLAQRFN